MCIGVLGQDTGMGTLETKLLQLSNPVVLDGGRGLGWLAEYRRAA
jgi:hypothetical protein